MLLPDAVNFFADLPVAHAGDQVGIVYAFWHSNVAGKVVIACLMFGMLTLIAAPVPELGVSPWIAFSVGAAFGLITVFLVRLAVRARRMKSRLGIDALLGSAAQAMEELTPAGHVLVEGEIWQAVASEPVAKGAALRVVGHDAYLLRVEPVAGVHLADAHG